MKSAHPPAQGRKPINMYIHIYYNRIHIYAYTHILYRNTYMFACAGWLSNGCLRSRTCVIKYYSVKGSKLAERHGRWTLTWQSTGLKFNRNIRGRHGKGESDVKRLLLLHMTCRMHILPHHHPCGFNVDEGEKAAKRLGHLSFSHRPPPTMKRSTWQSRKPVP